MKANHMSEIMIEETNGSSDKSLTQALASAIKTALKPFNGDHQLNITVMVEGYTFQNGKFRVRVKVMVMDITKEKEKALHDKQKEFEDKMIANQNLSEQMIAAIYNRNIYDHSKPVEALEQRMDSMGNRSDIFDFNANEDNINLIASQGFHDQLRRDYEVRTKADPNLTSVPPSLDLGGGTSSSHKDTA